MVAPYLIVVAPLKSDWNLDVVALEMQMVALEMQMVAPVETVAFCAFVEYPVKCGRVRSR